MICGLTPTTKIIKEINLYYKSFIKFTNKTINNKVEHSMVLKCVKLCIMILDLKEW